MPAACALPRAVLAFGLCLLVSLAGHARADETAAPESSPAKITRLLEASGYNYKKAPKSDSVWSVDYTGKSLPSYKVVIAVQGNLLVIFVTVARKRHLPMTNDFMLKLLRFNHSLDRVKVGIDDDGDLAVRTDLSVRTLDSEELKLNVDQVAASADAVYADIKQDLVDGTP